MRPYLAVFRDSFDEALDSRVLWVVVGLTTLLLVALAPLAVTDELEGPLGPDDIVDVGGLADALVKAGQASDRPSPGLRLWTLASDRARQNWRRLAAADDPASESLRDAVAEFLDGLNGLLARPDLYDEPSWQRVRLGDEAKTLLKRDDLRGDAVRVARRNRLLLEAAYPALVEEAAPPAVRFDYLGLLSDLPAMPVRKESIVNDLLQLFMRFFLGTVGVFTAILLTSTMIPHTFEAGAVDLLLSKPVHRGLLYVTKFLGGCVFITLSATYMIVGLWLLSGWRYGVWNARLLWCVPLFLLLFAVYYAFSALVGLVWRNAIVSVVLTVLFWLACFLLDMTYRVTQAAYVEPRRFVRLVEGGGDLLAVDQFNVVYRWQDETRDWHEIFAGKDRLPNLPGVPGLPLMGPVHDPDGQQFVAAIPGWPGRRRGGFGNSRLERTSAEDQWQAVPGIPLPGMTLALWADVDGSLLALTTGGVFRSRGPYDSEPEQLVFLGIPLPVQGKTGAFEAVGPEMSWTLSAAAAWDPVGGRMAIADRRRVVVLRRGPDGKFVEQARRDLEGDQPKLVGCGGEVVAVAEASGTVRIYRASDLAEQRVAPAADAVPPKAVHVAPDGRRALVIDHDRRLHAIDTATGLRSQPAWAPAGEVSALAFRGADRALVAEWGRQVREIDLTTGRATETRRARSTPLDWIFRWVMRPLHAVLPKPLGEGMLINYVITGKERQAVESDLARLDQAQAKLDWQETLWSSLGFVAALVAAGCVYLSRREF